jgi:hypothetical protein
MVSTQLPPQHVCPAPQAAPQAPQLMGFVLVSTHAPPQQTDPVPQVTPQAPQLAASTSVSKSSSVDPSQSSSRPSQLSVRGSGAMHSSVGPTQPRIPSAHRPRSPVPQLISSIGMSSSTPLQSSSAPALSQVSAVSTR